MGFILVLQCVFQYLGYFLSLAYHPCPIWTVSQGLCYWGSFQRLLPIRLTRFRSIERRSLKVWWIFRLSPRDLACLIHQLSWRYTLLLLGWFFNYSFMEVLEEFLSCLPVSKGLQNSCKDCSVLVIDSLRSLLPDLLFVLIWLRKSTRCIIPSLQQDYFGSRISSSFCRVG